MTASEETLKTLAHNLLAATPVEITAKCSFAKFILFCEATRDKLLGSKISGRLQLAAQLGLKANSMKFPEKTDAEILELVKTVFPNASIATETGEKARASVKREGKPRDTPRHPVLTEHQMELGRQQRKADPYHMAGALPIPGCNPNDPDDQEW